MNMQLTLAVIACIALLQVGASPVDLDGIPVEVKRWTDEEKGKEGYSFEYELANGSTRKEVGELTLGDDIDIDLAKKIVGSYSWIVDGLQILVNFIADSNGFMPTVEINRLEPIDTPY